MIQKRLPSLSVDLQKAIASSEHNYTLKTWLSLIDGSVTFDELARYYSNARKLSFLAVDTTGVCDLTCPGMCYYHPDIDVRRPIVPLNLLEQAISDAASELQLQTLVFSGKEPLANGRRLVEVAELAGSISERKFEIGLITNGRLISRYWEELASLARSQVLSFMDISIDSGDAVQHDNIRGRAGTYDLAVSALRRCSESWPSVRIGTASVLRDDNAAGILKLIENSAAFNRNFFISPIQPPPFTSTKPVAWQHIQEFISALQICMDDLPAGSRIEVTLSLPSIYIYDAVLDELFDWCDIREDAAGQCYVRTMHGQSDLIFLLQILPETGHAVGRITYSGAYLPNTHFLQSTDPDRHAVGTLYEASLPELHRRAVSADSALSKMFRSRPQHECRGRACWPSCFGGLTLAENSFVGGPALEARPDMCLKTERDFSRTHEEGRLCGAGGHFL